AQHCSSRFRFDSLSFQSCTLLFLSLKLFWPRVWFLGALFAGIEERAGWLGIFCSLVTGDVAGILRWVRLVTLIAEVAFIFVVGTDVFFAHACASCSAAISFSIFNSQAKQYCTSSVQSSGTPHSPHSSYLSTIQSSYSNLLPVLRAYLAGQTEYQMLGLQSLNRRWL